jgi:hypothetical protein
MATRSIFGVRSEQRALNTPLVVLMLCLAANANAQFPGGGGRMHVGSGSSGTPSIPIGNATPTNRLRDQMDTFADQLQPQASQQAAFDSYRKRMLLLAGDIERSLNGGDHVEGNAPRQLQTLGDIARDRATAIDDIVSAASALYAQLDGRQRALADSRMPWMLTSLLRGETTPPPPEQGAPPERRRAPAPPSG